MSAPDLQVVRLKYAYGYHLKRPGEREAVCGRKPSESPPLRLVARRSAGSHAVFSGKAKP